MIKIVFFVLLLSFSNFLQINIFFVDRKPHYIKISRKKKAGVLVPAGTFSSEVPWTPLLVDLLALTPKDGTVRSASKMETVSWRGLRPTLS